MNRLFDKILTVLILLFFTGFSCINNNPNNKRESDSAKNITNKTFKILSPSRNQEFKDSGLISFRIALLDSSKKPDSVQFLMDSKIIGSIIHLNDSLTLDTRNLKMGTRSVDAIGFFKEGTKDHDYLQIKIGLSQKPVNYTYKIMQAYPHDKNAYTQGLVFDKNYLYEGTGIYERSSLRKVNIANGLVVTVYNLPSDIFGEGIAIFDNKIIQISWKEQVAFLYDKESFQLLNKFYYPIKEGWGLTYDGKNLIMSNGSSVIYFLDKEYFTEVSKIEVYDNSGPVEQLNELEYINGEIWANVYLTDIIVRINPNTGAVTGKIDLTGLLKQEDKNLETDVLNGIAYDSINNRIFVTGKNWPKLFEINLLPE